MSETGNADILNKRFTSINEVLRAPGVSEMLTAQFGSEIAQELTRPEIVQMIQEQMMGQERDAELLDVAEDALPRIAPDSSVDRRHDIAPLEPVLLELQGLRVRGTTGATLQKIFSVFNSDEVQQRLAARKAVKPIVNTKPKIGRNDPCPCGCGKKVKKCQKRTA